MPTYTYQCSDCSNAFEQFQKFAEDPLTICPTCGGTIKRVMHAPGIVFKGSGWYINDTRKGGSSESPSTSPSSTSTEPASTPSTSTSSESAPAATPAPAPVAAKAAD